MKLTNIHIKGMPYMMVTMFKQARKVNIRIPTEATVVEIGATLVRQFVPRIPIVAFYEFRAVRAAPANDLREYVHNVHDLLLLGK